MRPSKDITELENQAKTPRNPKGKKKGKESS